MNVKATLSRQEFIRISIWQHLRRPSFYFFSLTCAVLTAIALFQGDWLLGAAGWVPFLLYIILGIIGAYVTSRDQTQSIFQTTEYKFTPQGIVIKTDDESSQLNWEQLRNWKFIGKCYVLTLQNNAVIAIPKATFSSTQVGRFEAMLNDNITD